MLTGYTLRNKSPARGTRVAPWALGAIALLLLVHVPAATAQTTSASLPPLGMSIGSISGLKAADAAPKYGSYWVGEWMASSGWGGFDSAMKTAKAEGVTPVLYWYYWGDSISPTCFDADGCDGRNEAEWNMLTDQFVSRLQSTLGGAEALIVLENEFNKGGITGTYAPTFDAKLEKIALKLKAVAGVKLVVGFGAWAEQNWQQFPKTIAVSEYVGYQMMRASTKDTETSYRAAADRSAYLSNYIAQQFNKPSFLYDVALSSYPDDHWKTVQAETLDAIFSKLVTSGNTGLQGVVYRSLNDHYMSPANYYGEAESHWGLRTSDGTAKPAFDVWVKHARGASTLTSSAPPPPPAQNVPGAFEGETMSATKGGLKTDASASGGKAWNLWSNGQLSTTLVADSAQDVRITVHALGQAAGGISPKMELRLGGAALGTFDVVPGGYGQYFVDAPLPAGSSTLAIAFTNDAVVGTEDRNLIVDVTTVGAVPPPPPPPANEPPTAAFDATASGLSASFDASGSADADGDALSHAWTFGDGAAGSGVGATHTYAADGEYLVTLTVSDGKASATASRAITVVRPNSPPVAAFSANMQDLTGTFDAAASSDADGDALTYEWSFGSASVGAQHTFPAPGSYTVTLTVSDGKATATATQTVTATYPAPIAQATASGTGKDRVFDGSGSSDPAGGALTHTWTFTDGSSASGAVVSKTLAPGEHTATLTVANRFGETATAAVSVSVARDPYAATFTPVNGNANWVQVRVDANEGTSAVCVSINGGTCQPLQLKSWGDWAAGMKVASNARVTYTATSAYGDKVTSAAYSGSSSKLAPTVTPMTATFTPHDGNNYWVQTKVASNKAIAAVCASVDGGSCRALELKSWGSWAASFYVRTGAKVVFTATATTGEKISSPAYAWPVN